MPRPDRVGHRILRDAVRNLKSSSGLVHQPMKDGGLQEIDLETLDLPLPGDIRILIDDAEARIDDFVKTRRDLPLAGFVPSEFDLVHRTLSVLSERMDGGCFVEWGSGFGVVAMMAALLGFDARGIEIQQELVDASEQLASDYEIDVEFVCGTFVPDDVQGLVDKAEWPAWLECGGLSGHALLDLEPRDVDVVFSYPWPGEANVVESIFERVSRSGALLLVWKGLDEMRLLRKE